MLDWHKKEKPIQGLVGLGGGIVSKLIIGTADTGSYFFATLGGTQADAFWGVATDSNNNIYASGQCRSADIGTLDLFIASYDNKGTIRWQKAAGVSGSNFDAGQGCAVDSSDNVYVSGYNAFDGNVITKFNSSGDLQFDKKYDGTGTEGYGPVAIDGSDNIYSFARNGENSGSNVMMKINSSGTLQFNRILSDSHSMSAGSQGCTVDSSGNSYGVGSYDDDDNGQNSGFLVKYNSSGTIQWQVVTEGSYASDLLGVTTDGTNVYAAGTSNNPSSTFAFLTKWNTSGVLQWQRRLNIASQFADVALDSDGNIYCAGSYSSGDRITIIVKFNSSGTLQWARTLSRSGYDTRARAITVDSSDQLIVVGETDGAGPGNDSGFILRIPNDGTLTGTYNNMSYSTSSASSVEPAFYSQTTSITDAAHDMTASNVTGRTLSTTTFTSTTTDIE